jgi:endo-1,4-beta-xylanase
MRPLAVFLVLATLSNSALADPGSGCAADSLCDAASSCGRHMGAAVQYRYLADFGEPLYRDTLAREFNQLSAENEMKFAGLRPSRDSYSFRDFDVLVAFAEAHDMRIRGHTLLWHNCNPDWVLRGHFTPSELSDILHQHIRTVMSRYRSRIDAWDVVNEAFQDDRGVLRSSIWYDSPGIGAGPDYVAQSFVWAQETDPGAMLFYNDFFLDFDFDKPDSKIRAVFDLVKNLRDRHHIVNLGVGLQMHVDSQDSRSIDAMEEAVRRFNDIGVAVELTELDVRMLLPFTAQRDSEQADLYHRIATACTANSGCGAIQTWGVSDAHSWIPEFFPFYGAALPFDLQYQPKAAYRALKDALQDCNETLLASPAIKRAQVTALSDRLVDDFEESRSCPHPTSNSLYCNYWSGEWQPYSENVATLNTSYSLGRDGTGRALTIDGTFNIYALLQTFLNSFTDGVQPSDLTAYDAVRFDVKGDDRPYWFQFAPPQSQTPPGGDNFGHPFWAPPTWTTVTLRFQDFQQRGFPSCVGEIEGAPGKKSGEGCTAHEQCSSRACGIVRGEFHPDSVVALQWMNLTQDHCCPN